MNRIWFFLALLLPALACAQPVLPGPAEMMTIPPPAGSPYGVASQVTHGDFDGDGRTDLAVLSGLRVLVYRQDGAGQLLAPEVVALDSYGVHAISTLVAADLDGDGRDDLVAQSQSHVQVRLARGPGLWAPGPAVISSPHELRRPLKLRDLDRDGRLDLVLVEQEVVPERIDVGAGIRIYPGDGQGGFRSPISLPLGPISVLGMDIADLDGDRHEDLVLHAHVLLTGSGMGQLQVRRGRGGFGFESPVAVGGTNARRMVVMDANGDGRLDLLVTPALGFDASDSELWAFMQNADRSFPAEPVRYAALGPMMDAGVGDVDGDGREDLVFLPQQLRSLGVYLQAGERLAPLEEVEFSAPGTTFPKFGSVSIGDINGDGRGDIAVAMDQYGVLLSRTRANPAYAPGSLPGAPTILSISHNPDVEFASVAVSPPASDGGLPILGYRLFSDPHQGDQRRPTVGLGSPPYGAGTRDMELFTPYRFTVRAFNAAGYGPPSAPVDFVRLPVWRLSVDSITVPEGDTGSAVHQVPVRLNYPAPAGGVTFDARSMAGTARPGIDYLDVLVRDVHIPQGESVAWVPVTIIGNTEIAPDATFYIGLENPRGARYHPAVGIVRIVDDEPRPPTDVTLSGGSDSVYEGGPGERRKLRLWVVANRPAHVPVMFDLVPPSPGPTGSLTVAESGVDFDATPIRDIVIPVGEQVAMVEVDVFGDAEGEYDEAVSFLISNMRNANRNGFLPSAYGTILDDDRPPPPLVARTDRFVLSQNQDAVQLRLAANDDFVLTDTLNTNLVLTPSLGKFWPVNEDPVQLSRNYHVYKPNSDAVGRSQGSYVLCEPFRAGQRCIQGQVDIVIRPLPEKLLDLDVDSDAGFRDVPLERMGRMDSARWEPTPLVTPETLWPTLPVDTTPALAWDGARGGTHVVARRIEAPQDGLPRQWLVLADVFAQSSHDIDLYLGIDTNLDGQADASELVCTSAMARSAESCELELSQPGNAAVGYWVMMHNRGSGPSATRADIALVPATSGDSRLVATGPARLAPLDEGRLRIAWDDPTLLPGDRRVGFLRVRRDAQDAGAWVPLRIGRSPGAAAARALVPGQPLTLRVESGQPHERLFVDVPAGAALLSVELDSPGEVDLYVARSSQPDSPAIEAAPARTAAFASSRNPGGQEQVVVAGADLVPGRWYITPTVERAPDARMTISVNLVANAAPAPFGSYFNAARSGHGLFVYPAANQWVGLWYTYFQDGTPTWLYLQGPKPGDTGIWRAPIYRAAADANGTRLVVVGKASLTPMESGGQQFTYQLDGETGSERLGPLGGGCPTLAGLPLDASSHWFNPARAGTGYSAQLFPNYEFYTSFVYDSQGVPRFLLAERSGFGGGERILPLLQLEGFCPLCERTGNPRRYDVGTLLRRFEGGVPHFEADALYSHGVPGFWTRAEATEPLGGPGSTQGCPP